MTSGANESSTEPVLFMIASPMGAAGFGTLSGYFTDRTVVTYDPRGRSEARSPMTPRNPRRMFMATICTG